MEEIELSFTDVIVVYLENSKQSAEVLLETIEKISKKAKDRLKQLFFQWNNINQYIILMENDTNQNCWL